MGDEIFDWLQERGFHLFPLKKEGTGKLPAIKDFAGYVGGRWLGYNHGISTSQGLLAVDIDPKKGGFQSLMALELQGFPLPETYTQYTPSGGQHLVYTVPEAVKQGVDVLGPGLDIRSKGGYIVAAGSVTPAGKYTCNLKSPVPAPHWLIDACGKAREKSDLPAPIKVDEGTARLKVQNYLYHAPVAVQGQGGDATTFQVCARVKDFGLPVEESFNLLADIWNPNCEPPWDLTELRTKLENAYRYGTFPPGVSSPEAEFQEVSKELQASSRHPVEKMNDHFAFVTVGGAHHILWETTDVNGKFLLEHLSEHSFHKMFAPQNLITADGKKIPITELWIKDPKRRSYKGLCFKPEVQVPEDWYNVWRGFAVEPLAPEKASPRARSAVQSFFNHALENVCGGDEVLYTWLVTYFAHLIQKPSQKPLVALVFKGEKGVGKSALVDRIGYLLGGHYLATAERRYLTGNFNAHLENCLLLALEEAYWAGDPQAEGVLKHLITGATHTIERKGQESYKVDNCTRVVIIGNEKWIVPASEDERRYAVFNVGAGKKQNRAFFKEMREGMEANKGEGYSLLLHKLQTWNLSQADVDQAPVTEGLRDQKLATLDPFDQWWFQCLSDAKIVNGSSFSADDSDSWPEQVDKENFRISYERYHKARNIRSRVMDAVSMGRSLKRVLPSCVLNAKRREGQKLVNVYKIPDLKSARESFEKFLGHKIEWE